MFSHDEQTKDLPQQAPSIQERPAHASDFFRRFHHHSLSDSSLAGSNDSSPTTTISTVDDSSATEPSPGSSPESPPPSTFAVGMIRPRTSDESRPFFELQKQPPPKKGRNLKGLAVTTNRPQAKAFSTTSLPLPLPNADSPSTIASPSFVKPPTPPKRKPSNLGLTLLTPGTSKAPPQEIRLAIPPTPAFNRPGTLRHFQSSPSLPLFPALASQNYATPPVPRVHPTLETIMSPVEPEPKPVVEEQEEQDFEIPLSQEEKPEAYPDGPICVYEPHIDLYLEPTAEQCREYDVIFNVASEVRNPLEVLLDEPIEEQDIRIDGGGGIQFAPKRERVPAQKAQESTFDSSPTTPKATPLETTFASTSLTTVKKEPEYIHIKWEHNSDIVPDLLGLVKLIDDKVMQGKRVLIHCQCGVSRSASLIVAYGLYKDRTLSVQEAYDVVKKRSKWIGPNMNLIMQLQEFRSSLMRGGLLPSNRGLSPITPSSAFREWQSPFSFNAASSNLPLPGSGAPLVKARSTEPNAAMSPGPSSAPSGLPWPLPDRSNGQRARAVSAVKPGTAYVDTAGHVVPVLPVLNIVGAESGESSINKIPPTNPEQIRDEADSTTPTETTASPRSEEFAMTPLQPSPDVAPADDFGLMSPSSTEFASSPFDRSALLAQLGMGPLGQQEDLAPRRSTSLRSKPPKEEKVDAAAAGDGPKKVRRLRPQLSSPSIREQQQLQSLQTEIAASLFHRSSPPATIDGVDDALMSPRATEFTQNPFALSLSIPATPAAQSEAPRSSDSDPRSPATKGGSPIVRSILDVL